MNMIRFIIAALMAFCISAKADTTVVTRAGITVDVATAEGTMAETRDLSVITDSSKIPSTSDRDGYFFRWVNVPDLTGATATDVQSTWEPVPDNFIIESAILDPGVAVTPATATVAIAVGGVTVQSATTNLGVLGTRLIRAANATVGKTTNSDNVAITATGATNGQFMILLRGTLGQ